MYLPLPLPLPLSLSLSRTSLSPGPGTRSWCWFFMAVFISFAGILYVKWSSKMLPKIYSMVDIEQ